MAQETADELSQKVQGSLEDTPYACTSLVKLSGGTANFVYRGILVTPLEDGSRTIVIKHTEPYVASNFNFKLTATRCEFEETILAALHDLPPVLRKGVTVQTPHLYYFFPETDTQIYSDLPSSLDLKTYVLKHPLTQVQCMHFGHAIGLWARHFHAWANAPEQGKLRESIKGNTAMLELKYRLNYGMNLIGTVDNFPELLEGSRKTFEALGMRVRDELDSEEGSLIHGDFWSGNVLLPDILLTDEETPIKLFVIDWELSHISSLAFDLGQMFAELFELKHFKDIDAGVWLIEAFMQGYGNIDDDFAFRTAIHVGVHLICWGSRVQGWGTKEQVEKVVEVGRDFVVKGWEKDRAFFESTALKCVFR
ncbi:kinase-like domain-containing protein [Hyaloscypha sp. PMI_1271]|nr:kinase-like domain-containing protein [Hyaloscypha sp. PMI_1271]